MRGNKADVKSSVSFTVHVAANGYIVAAGEDPARGLPNTRYVARDADELMGLVGDLLADLVEPGE